MLKCRNHKHIVWTKSCRITQIQEIFVFVVVWSQKKIFAKEAPGRAHEYVSSFEKLFLYNLYQWVIAYKRNRTWTMYFSCVWISPRLGTLGLLVEEYVVCNMYVNMFLLIKFERNFCQIVLCVGGGKENTNGAQSVYSIPLTTMHLWCV